MKNRVNSTGVFLLLLVSALPARAGRPAECGGYAMISGRPNNPVITVSSKLDLSPGLSHHDTGTDTLEILPPYSLSVQLTVAQGRRGGEWLLYQVALLKNGQALAVASGSSGESGKGDFTLASLENPEVWNWEHEHPGEELPANMLISLRTFRCSTHVSPN